MSFLNCVDVKFAFNSSQKCFNRTSKELFEEMEEESNTSSERRENENIQMETIEYVRWRQNGLNASVPPNTSFPHNIISENIVQEVEIGNMDNDDVSDT